MKTDSPLTIRTFRPGDETELWNLFYHTVRRVNIQDYSEEQLAAWAPDSPDLKGWGARVAQNRPYICQSADTIVGFADLQQDGYIDQFFVHWQWQRKGVGKLLFDTIQSEADRRNLSELSANVSRTALPFFQSRGFHVVTAQIVTVRNVEFQNYKMVKQLT